MTPPPIPDDEFVGQRILDALRWRGIRHGDIYATLTEITGLQRNSAYMVVSGRRAAQLKHLRAVAEWAGVPLAYFFQKA